MDNFDDLCDFIEQRIRDFQNDNYASPLAQDLLDEEADIVLREYYASPEYREMNDNEVVISL